MTVETADGGDLFRQIVENSSLGLLVTDLEGNIVYANPRQCETSGYDPGELIGKNVRIFRTGETPAAIYRDMAETLITGDTWSGDILNRNKDGRLIREYVRISPIKDNDNHLHLLLVIKDGALARVPESESDYRSPGIDALTGLPTRNALLTRMEGIIAHGAGKQAEFSMLILDIDHFRKHNQSLGQISADQMLIEVATRLAQAVRSEDLLARVGGDEFGLVLRGITDEHHCMEMASRILNAISEPMDLDWGIPRLTGSIGVARFPVDARDAGALFDCAESALAGAKHQGGAGIHIFKPQVDARISDRGDLRNELHHVAERNELRLHYQPQISLNSGDIIGAEALLRWQHPQRGMVPPNEFIPFAEETGQIIAISEWVLREACRQARAWLNAGLPPLRIAVNLSARHFRYGTLPETVAQVLSDFGIEARNLELEITESVMMHDATRVVHIVDRLKKLGIKISLDDFGSGYSSLAYLSRFAIDRLKIDQSFIRDITTNPINASIATATIAMAHKLGKIVIAEGVETDAQMQFLRRHDCDEMQGFLFSKPLPPDQFETMLASGKHVDFGACRVDTTQQQTLLLVDDERNILNALRRLFRKEDFRVLTANSGAEALELLALNSVQVVISDHRMPGMSGVELLSRVKDLYPKTERIVLSGYSELSTVTDAINRGAVRKYISKPWDDETLLHEVRAIFRSLHT